MLSASVWGARRGWRRRRTLIYRCLFALIILACCASLFSQEMAPLYDSDADDDDDDVMSENIVRGLRSHRDIDDEIVGESEEQDEDYDEDNDNPVFREGDFDGLVPQPEMVDVVASENGINEWDYGGNVDYVSWNAERKLQGQYDSNVEAAGSSSESLKSESETFNETEPSAGRLTGRGGIGIVESGIFWSADVEKQTPQGFDDQYVADFRTRVRRLPVASIQPPSWDRCGRPKNQYVTLADGTPMCARYRTPHDYLVQGEVMSFYLARLLGIQNVPIVVLSQADWNSHQWKRKKVRQQLKTASWTPNATVSLIQWIHHLERDRMPLLLLNALRNQSSISISASQLSSLLPEQLAELLQWSDLIVFDYITGNYDRVASMQDAADKEEKPSILGETIHNLAKSKKTNGLWLIDNESGLLDAYSLLYSNNQPNQQAGRFVAFHRQVLRTMCIFRHSTHERIKWLHRHGDAKKLLLDMIGREEPLFAGLPDVRQNGEFVQHFQQRIAEVYRHTRHCYDEALAAS